MLSEPFSIASNLKLETSDPSRKSSQLSSSSSTEQKRGRLSTIDSVGSMDLGGLEKEWKMVKGLLESGAIWSGMAMTAANTNKMSFEIRFFKKEKEKKLQSERIDRNKMKSTCTLAHDTRSLTLSKPFPFTLAYIRVQRIG